MEILKISLCRILTCCFKASIELSIAFGSGSSINGNFRTLGKPIAIICNKTESNDTRCISGVVYSVMAAYSSSEYRRKQTPGPVRPRFGK